MADKRVIHVSIGALKLPVRVSKENEQDEELVRKAAKLINKRMNQYQKMFSDKDIFDILAMTSLELTKELMVLDRNKESAVGYEVITRINDKLDEVLEE